MDGVEVEGDWLPGFFLLAGVLLVVFCVFGAFMSYHQNTTFVDRCEHTLQGTASGAGGYLICTSDDGRILETQNHG